MRNQVHHQVQPLEREAPCDICGVEGWKDVIATCSVCKTSREHIYCMKILMTYVQKSWVCEECITGTGCVEEHGILGSSQIIHDNVVSQTACINACDESVRIKRHEAVKTVKTKFLSEEVKKLQSGPIKEFNSEDKITGKAALPVTPKVCPSRVKLIPSMIYPEENLPAGEQQKPSARESVWNGKQATPVEPSKEVKIGKMNMEIDLVGGQRLGNASRTGGNCEESNKKVGDENALKEMGNKHLISFDDLKSPVEQARKEAKLVHSSQIFRKINTDWISVEESLPSSIVEADTFLGSKEISRLNSANKISKGAVKESTQSFDGSVVQPVQSCPIEVNRELQQLSSGTNSITRWCPPPTDWVKLNVAGSSKHPAGPTGASGVIRDHCGKWVVGYTMNMGTEKVLRAVFQAVLEGLRLAWNKRFRKVVVECESRVAIELLKRPPSALDLNRGLIDSCVKLMKLEWECKVEYVRRDSNLCARRLATSFGGLPMELTVLDTQPTLRDESLP